MGGEEAAVRLQVYLARAGVASRRGSERLIDAGRVAVNGERVTEQGVKVVPGRDRVTVDGREVEPDPVTWIALHKPAEVLTERGDRFGRRTVYDLLPERFGSLFHVGRLDLDSEGLLLLTNDGTLAHRLLHPRYGVTKEYRVTVKGQLTAGTARTLERGVVLDDGPARALEARIVSAKRQRSTMRLVLREGRKREVRRMCEAVGHPVVRLVRTRFGSVELGRLPAGKWRELDADERESLAEATGARD
jgi:23S rRNA pseudouridine2605 synthase